MRHNTSITYIHTHTHTHTHAFGRCFVLCIRVPLRCSVNVAAERKKASRDGAEGVCGDREDNAEVEDEVW